MPEPSDSMNSSCKTESKNAKTSKKAFLIEFNEDGSPIECHKFIRMPCLSGPLPIKFRLSEAFISESSAIGLDIKRDGKLFIKTSFNEDNLVEINFTESGTFCFNLYSDKIEYCSGFIQIPPSFINPDNIKVITLVSKWMGPIQTNWESFYAEVKSLDYNMIHFTPIQQRGLSNSPYSIKDQLKLSDDLFVKRSTQETEQLESSLKVMNEKYGISGMIDVIWNHTACDSEWLKDHPEAGYNLQNSPHLKVAYELDESILSFSSSLNSYELSGELNNENDLLDMMQVFKEKHLPKSKLWEFFVINVSESEQSLENEISKLLDNFTVGVPIVLKSLCEAHLNDGKYERYSNTMNVKLAVQFYSKEIELIHRSDLSHRSVLISQILSDYRQRLDQINLEKYREYDEIIESACRNIFNRAVYERIADHGPKLGEVSENLPLVPTYFTRVPNGANGFHALANNGWIWNADPFNNFAEATSQAYVRRDVIVWGDCVKLRYGSGPEDNPWLWDHMTEYTRQMAKLFQAFRIDNCHSTPIHVASHLLREARAIRSDLFVCAELFTGSEEKDMCFVTSLGINSLIREAMVSWDHQEISRLTLNYGGQPIGSLQQLPEFIRFDSTFENQNYNVSHMKSRPHNIFFDCTHDNEPPSQKRTPQDTLSNSAIVAFSCCATGSTFGYDQLVPHHVNIVEERRKYERCTSKSPLSSVKKYLNSFHSRMIEENCTEIFVKDYEDEIVLISRDDPLSHCGYTLIARTAYASGPNDSVSEVIDFPGCDVKVVCSAYFTKIEATEFQKDPKVINGLNSEISFIDGGVPDGWFSSNHNSKSSFIELKVLPPGAFIILQRMPLEPIRLISLPFLKGDLNVFELKKACANFDLNDFNYIMYRCEEEEKDHFPEIGGVYNIPNYGDLLYCGFEGFNLVLKSIERYNDLDHALCSNLREGTWILDYTVARLERLKDDRFDPLIHWTKLVFEHLKALSGYLRPKYAAKVFRVMDEAFKDRIFEQMSPRLQDCGEFGKTLALGSVQMVGRVPSTGLTVKAYNDSESDPILRMLTYSSSMSAGLPHFSTHHMRCWGRDIFISFRGLLLIPGRFEVARAHLLAFSSCVYKGLIPNLLDSCRRPRYNARDATWWYLQALQDYCKYSPEGYAILGISVPLRFPGGEYVDFDDPSIFSRKKTIKEIVQQILQSHAEGIHFREWNAGPQLDSVMRWEGFQVDIFTDWRTGLIHGGNRWNCGTWMDKMGESELAGNRGIPTTPRDGAAIEITALHKSTLEWLASLHSFGFSGVKTFVGDQGEERFITYTEWSQLLSESFEGEYFMPDVGYYRDTVRLLKDCDENDTMITTNVATTYTPEQMRPNYFVAMAIAPELFNPCHGRCALALAERHLSGPLGMRTLAPFEAAYRPNYDNSLDCPDSSLAKGANYHQGPEWLWCMGFYLRAWLTFNISTADAASARKLVLTRLQPHRHFLLHSQSGSLPELTNENGSPCSDSCWNQAWSMACLLEVVLQVAATTKEQEQD